MKVKNLLLILILLLSPFSDLLAGQWVKKENLGGVARHRATGVSIGQKGYIGLGHVNGTGVNFAFSDWWEFEPATNSWTQKADYLLGETYGTSAFSVHKGICRVWCLYRKFLVRIRSWNKSVVFNCNSSCLWVRAFCD